MGGSVLLTLRGAVPCKKSLYRRSRGGGLHLDEQTRATIDSRVVEYNGRTYRSLPKHPDIELGHIRKMIRHLGINRDCASKLIPNV